MRKPIPGVLLGLLVAAQVVQAQEPRLDTATVARAHRSIIRTGEVIGLLAATGIAMAVDQTVRDRIHDPHDSFGRTASDIGNAIGSGFEYPALFLLAAGGKAFGSHGLYGVSSRAFKSIALAGAAGVVIKVIVGRERPDASPNDNLSFHPVSFKDNSFPSGHTVVAFALATSFSREITGRWDDAGFFTLASLTAYARMHDDRHWLSDAVFGAGLGILAARFVHRREAKILMGKNVFGLRVEF